MSTVNLANTGKQTYENYYGLSGNPFRLSPGTGFFYGSSGHKRALAYLLYGLNQSEGFVVITGAPGTGKTTLAHKLLAEMDGANLVVAHVNSTQIKADDLLRMVAASFGLSYEGVSKARLIKAIESFLVARSREGKRCILVVDEAQNLPACSLEELRMLSNFIVGGNPLLQSFLLGQEQFRHMLDSADLEQLRQRVIADYHLNPMNGVETKGYIESRLRCVGWRDNPHFSVSAYQAIYEYTEGVPRRINVFCDRLLLFGYLEELHNITAETVDQVITELMDGISSRHPGLAFEPVEESLDQLELAGEDVLPSLSFSTATGKIVQNGDCIDSGGELPGKMRNDDSAHNLTVDSANDPLAIPSKLLGESSGKSLEGLLEKTLQNLEERVLPHMHIVDVTMRDEQNASACQDLEATQPAPGEHGKQRYVQVQLVAAMLDFHRQGQTYSDAVGSHHLLGEELDVVLELALASDREIFGRIPIQMKETRPTDLRAAARAVVRGLLFRPNATHYQVLGLLRNVSTEMVQRRYNCLMQLFHADRKKHPGPWNTDFAPRIIKAYGVLNHPQSKQAYDQELDTRQTRNIANQRGRTTSVLDNIPKETMQSGIDQGKETPDVGLELPGGPRPRVAMKFQLSPLLATGVKVIAGIVVVAIAVLYTLNMFFAPSSDVANEMKPRSSEAQRASTAADKLAGTENALRDGQVQPGQPEQGATVAQHDYVAGYAGREDRERTEYPIQEVQSGEAPAPMSGAVVADTTRPQTGGQRPRSRPAKKKEQSAIGDTEPRSDIGAISKRVGKGRRVKAEPLSSGDVKQKKPTIKKPATNVVMLTRPAISPPLKTSKKKSDPAQPPRTTARISAPKQSAVDSIVATKPRNLEKVITQQELSLLTFKFEQAYEEGNLVQFLSLFDERARTESGDGKEALRRDYEALFRKTDERKFRLSVINWERKGRFAQGTGSYEAKIRPVGGGQLKTFQGDITFHAIKSERGALITQIYFN